MSMRINNIPLWMLSNEYTQQIAQNIHQHCRIDSTTGCWKHSGVTARKPYPRIKIKYRGIETSWGLSRIIYAIVHCTVDVPGLVLHTCDTPACCNPDHLYIGDHHDNAMDAARSGVLSRAIHTVPFGLPGKGVQGERHALSVLTDKAVREICCKYRMGLGSARTLAQEYGVGHATIQDVLTGETWKHITNGEIQTPLVKYQAIRKHNGNKASAKLTEDIVYKMRCEYYADHGKLPYRHYAEKYRVDISVARDAILGVSWKHVASPAGMQAFLQTRV
jgi:hypothetical protein